MDLKVESWPSSFRLGNTESALERARCTVISRLAKHSTNDKLPHCVPLQLLTHCLLLCLWLSSTPLPSPLSLCLCLSLFLSVFVSLCLCPHCALLKQITPYLCLHERARQSQTCRRVEASGTYCLKMKKKNRLVRWIWWMVVVTALFLMGFIIGKIR